MKQKVFWVIAPIEKVTPQILLFKSCQQLSAPWDFGPWPLKGVTWRSKVAGTAVVWGLKKRKLKRRSSNNKGHFDMNNSFLNSKHIPDSIKNVLPARQGGIGSSAHSGLSFHMPEQAVRSVPHYVCATAFFGVSLFLLSVFMVWIPLNPMEFTPMHQLWLNSRATLPPQLWLISPVPVHTFVFPWWGCPAVLGQRQCWMGELRDSRGSFQLQSS